MSLITQMEELTHHENILTIGESGNLNDESSGISTNPVWAIWMSSILLCFTVIVGIPLNGVTVLIFLRRKKLRHLVNFVLLLDCLSHIILCILCIPVYLASVWSYPENLIESWTLVNWAALLTLQQVVRNFANLYGAFLSLSIAVLRYRRLCWKKKDKFSTLNAVKWSVSNGALALGITFTESWTSIKPSDFKQLPLTMYAIKVILILGSTISVFFCYIRVSQRVWANAASQEKVMDPIKLKKSRSVHLRATIHSCVQIILMVATTVPFIYEETIRSSDLFEGTTTTAVTSTIGDSHSDSTTQKIPTESMTTPFQLDPPLISPNNHLARLSAVTLNFVLLALGTPLAYIASCHRFREQFTSILFGRMGSTYLLAGNAVRHGGQAGGGIGHHDNNNTNNVLKGNGGKLKSPTSPTVEIFDAASLPRTRSQRSRSRSQPMALSPLTISSVMSTPGRGLEGRRASCQAVRVQMKGNKAKHYFSSYSYCHASEILSGNLAANGINQHFVNNFNYSSYGSSSSTSEIVGHNV